MAQGGWNVYIRYAIRPIRREVRLVEDWAAELARGEPQAAWDLFLGRYRRLMFAAIRHYADDYDEVMDSFAWVCERLREHDLRRLRSYVDQPVHTARFSTWLVTVVRHLAVDWFRHHEGRKRLAAVAAHLTPMQRRIFEHVFLDRASHVEAYERLKSGELPELSFREFLAELRATYRAVTSRRRGHILRELGVPLPDEPEAEPTSPIDSEERRTVLERALGALSRDDRLAVELYVIEGVSAEGVATILGLANAKAVYNRVYRALAAVRSSLERSGIHKGDL